MKRILVALVFFFGIMSAVNAQSSHFEQYDVVVTPHVGATYSYLNSNVDKWRFGVAGGASVSYYFSRKIATEFDLTYSWLGAKDLYQSSNTQIGPYNYDLHYINTDVLAKWYVMKDLSLFTGLHLGKLFSAKQKFDGQTTEVKDFMSRGHIAVPVGAAYDFGKLCLDARYYFPINKLPNKDNPDGILHPNTRAIGVVVTVGYKILVM